MKKIVILAMVMVFCLCGLVQAQMPPKGTEMSFRMNQGELELANQILIDEGFKNLVPIKGIMSGSKGGPTLMTLTCGKSNGGMVRVEVLVDRNPYKKPKIKVFE
jgi:hypothetical protein